jgi:threonine aldolase
MVKPHLAYISQPTELGGVYSLAELAGLREACDEYGLLLYLDGARLGAALASNVNDADLRDIARLCDAFYIGGTKNGLMFGEALIIVNDALASDFRHMQKQRGGLMAKGFILGIQFCRLFEGDLYFEMAAHADRMACRLRAGLDGLGIEYFVRTATNQLFPILSERTAASLSERFLFESWKNIGGDRLAVRFVTSWNTTEDEVDALLEAIHPG